MYKNYALWTPIKSKINNNLLYPRGFKQREVWICSIGDNIGFEQDGKGEAFVRPVLILKVFSRRFCYVIPLSTTSNRGKFHYPFNSNTGKISIALLSQLRAIDAVRLRRKIGFVGKEDFNAIRKRIVDLIAS